MCPKGHILCTYFELGTELDISHNPGLEGRGQEGGERPRPSFLLAGRGCCKEEEIRKDSWRMTGRMTVGRGKRVSQAEERTCARAERQSHAVLLEAQNLPV